MEIKLKNNTYELDLGIGFALALDKKYFVKQNTGTTEDLEFGVGVQMLYSKLSAVSIGALIEFFQVGLTDVKTVTYSKKDLQKAVEEKAVELKGFANLADECIKELQNVGLYNHIFEIEEEELQQLVDLALEKQK